MTAWPMVELGEVAEFRYGKSLPKPKRMPGNISVYGSNGIVGTHSEAYTGGTTVIIGRKGSFGEVHMSLQPCWPIDTTYYIDAETTKADLRWLYYRLSALGLTELNRAAAIPGLNREDAYRRKLLLPPLPEQRRIAAILDQADALRAKRRKALAQLDELTQSIFIDMFGDPATNPMEFPIFSLKDISCSKGEYGVGLSSRPWMPGDPRYIRITDVNEDGTLSNLKVAPAGTQTEWSKALLSHGDLLFARSGATVGKTYLHLDDSQPAVFAGYLIRFKLDSKKVLPEYVFRYTKCSFYKTWVDSSQRAVAQPNINAQQYGGLRFAIPPLLEQRKFAKQIERIEAMAAHHRQALTELDALFSSLQSRAFRGEL
ncbi:MAG: restriction endonuclease subunit S [Mycobacteriaceae bacterium]